MISQVFSFKCYKPTIYKSKILKPTVKGHKFTQGASLIEVLVSLIVVVIGTVGMMNLSGASIQDSRMSLYQTQANILVQQFVKRIRLNATDASLAVYEISGNSEKPLVTLPSNFSTVQLAKYDVSQWTREVIRKLPGSRYQVARKNEFIEVTVIWETQNSQTIRTKNCKLSVSDNESCLSLSAKICGFNYLGGNITCDLPS